MRMRKKKRKMEIIMKKMGMKRRGRRRGQMKRF